MQLTAEEPEKHFPKPGKTPNVGELFAELGASWKRFLDMCFLETLAGAASWRCFLEVLPRHAY